jgi:IrrE N-terminal-like domain
MDADSPIEPGLAEALAFEVLRDVRAIPPVDLHLVAHRLDVGAIERVYLTEEGRTTWREGRPVIELRNDRPHTRSRFTLAHELGHVVLATDGLTRCRTRSLEPDDEEVLCDWIAAALLMPRDWVRPYARREPYTLSLLRLVAHRADVSLSAAAVRLSEVGRRTCILLRWKRTEHRWTLVGQAGVPRSLPGYIEVTSETSAALDQVPHRRDTWLHLSVTVDGAPLRGRAHIDRQGSTCLTLFTELSGT